MKKGKPGRPPLAKSIKDFLSVPATRKLFDEGKAQVTEGGGGFAEYDDGKYRCRIVSATMGRSQASGRWQHVMGFKFLEGEYKGQTCFQYQGLENSMGFTMLVSMFSKLGIEIEAPEDLESADKKIVKEKPTVDIRLRTKGEFQNLLVLKPVDAEDAEEEVEEEDDSDEEQEDKKVEADSDEDEEEKEKAEEEDEDDDDSEDEDEDENEDSEDEDEEEEEVEKKKPVKKAVKKIVEEEDEADESDDESDDDDDEDEEEKDEPEEEKVTLDVGTKVKINYEDDKVIGKIVKVDEEKSRIKVKLKSGVKVWVSVPDDVIDVIA